MTIYTGSVKFYRGLMPKKILVVDDEPEILGLVQYGLEAAGYEVAICDNGRQVWDEIAKNKPDLMVMDVMLPGEDGYSIQNKISQNEVTKDIPVIILSALEPSKTLFQKFPQVVSFMTKPFRSEELLATVKAALKDK